MQKSKGETSMTKFINPFTDVGFKRIFGQEINKDLLIDFLNDLLAGEKHIKDIHFLDKEQLPVHKEDRGLIYDVYCTNEDGEQFIVEMQNRVQANFRDRAVYYISQAISRQGERGVSWQFKLKPVYGVFFMNFKLADMPNELRTDVVLANRKTNEPFSDKMRYIFLQLPYFDKKENECETDFERWIYVLNNMEVLQRMPFKAQKSVFERLEEIGSLASMSGEDRMKYDEAINIYRNNLAVNAAAIETGLEQGRKQGREEGRKQGDKKRQLETARRMIIGGEPVEKIVLYTGLTPEEIATL